MKLYLAPLEGITSYIYRKALYQCFDGLINIYSIYQSKTEPEFQRERKERHFSGK